MAGVAAFAGVTVGFLQQVSESAGEKNADSLLSSMPMMWEFGQAALPVIRKAGQVAVSGVGLPSFLQRRNLFSVTIDGQAKEVRDTKEVFEAIKTSGATDLFSGILFRDDALGWLNGVRRCDAAEAGRMLDASLSRSERGQFARNYFGDIAKGLINEYAFVNAFTVPTLGEREARLPDQLLGLDQRERFRGVGGEHLADVQRRVSAQYGVWSNQQLLRLIFANREGAARYATMDLGRISVRPTPSPDSVFVYESYINSCVARPAAVPAPVIRQPAPPVVRPPTVRPPAAVPPVRPPATPGATAPTRQ